MYHDAKAMSPAFGIHSTALDLAKLAQLLMGFGGKTVLSANALEAMQQRQASGRGLGFRILKQGDADLLSHGGWFAAYRSHLLIDTTNSIAVVTLTNSDNAAPGLIAEALYEAALKEIHSSNQ